MSADVAFVFSLWSLHHFVDPLPLCPPQQEEKKPHPDEPSALSNMEEPITLLQDLGRTSLCQGSSPAPSRLNVGMGTWGQAQPRAAVPSNSS